MTKNIAVLVGSIRQDSLNRKLALVLEKLAEGKLKFDYVQMDDLPYYNDDRWNDPPASVLRFKEQIARADGVLVITPEYNRSYPGILRNAFDWGSRPFGKGVWKHKPAATTGTSPGAIGTAVAQTALRSDLVNLSMHVSQFPEAYIQWKPEVYGDDGSVYDDNTRKFLQGFVDGFAEFIAKLG